MDHALGKNHAGFSLTSFFQRLGAQFTAARARRNALHQAYAELRYLNDRELMEYGLHRSDLFDLARAHSYRDRLTHF